ARRMARRRALVRRLPAVETLGSVTCICVDKTGTLTLNRMRAERWWLPGGPAGPSPPDTPARARLLQALALSHDVHVTREGEPVGEATEVALVEAVRAFGLDPREISARVPRQAELAFTAERARMTTLHREGDHTLAVTKGSPERVIAGCDWIPGPHGPEPLDASAALEQAERMAADGLRVLAVAERRDEDPSPASLERLDAGQTLLGLVGLVDPPRPEAAGAVATCRAAGITVIMITGDHPFTARAIATRLGILEHDGEVMSGDRLALLTPARLLEAAARVRVYARVTPDQKLAIISALQERHECVAMTGDGSNDAPALWRADVGVAMGQGGTDVAREAAPLVLLDDNFATLVSAVRDGRRIYDNIRKFVRYAVTCNAAEIATLLLGPLLGLPLALAPIQLLWVNLVTDGLPGIALALEPAEANLMRRPPRPRGENIFAGGLWQHVLWVGLLMTGVTLAAQALGVHAGRPHWQTMTFTVLALSQMGHVLAIRSERESLFRQGVTSNPALLLAVLLTLLLQQAVVYLPWANGIFRTAPLTAGELAGCLLLSGVVFIAVEAEKLLVRRGLLRYR
ncbi:MAG TPA: cation-transporting P-type ATPase, partial [Gemmatimonadales bacterium]|nr:cation-transporting P-type ATPase [Gemmatimonadales bacterium]